MQQSGTFGRSCNGRMSVDNEKRPMGSESGIGRPGSLSTCLTGESTYFVPTFTRTSCPIGLCIDQVIVMRNADVVIKAPTGSLEVPENALVSRALPLDLKIECPRNYENRSTLKQ